MKNLCEEDKKFFVRHGFNIDYIEDTTYVTKFPYNVYSVYEIGYLQNNQFIVPYYQSIIDIMPSILDKFNIDETCPIFLSNLGPYGGIYCYDKHDQDNGIILNILQIINEINLPSPIYDNVRKNHFNNEGAIIHVLIHELQHYIQDKINKKFKYSLEAKYWEGKKYMNRPYDFEEYLNLPWEIDANTVAINMANELIQMPEIDFKLRQPGHI